MQKIVPFLWFDKNAEEAANFYVAAFGDGKIVAKSLYPEGSPGPTGTVMSVTFELCGFTIGAINGGPVFRLTPAISFFVRCKTEQEVEDLWNKLSEGGSAMMPLGTYPFSKKYGWLKDRFGLTWQLNFDPEAKQKIAPSLLFTQEKYGWAKDAIAFYTSLLPDSKIVMTAPRTKEQAVNGEKEGTLSYSVFTMAGQEFCAMESGGPHQFTFNEAFSLLINCETQEEIDRLWSTMTAGGEESQCGWLKDKFGVSWQIAPADMPEIMSNPDPEKSVKTMQAMLKMKKLDIAALRAAGA